MKIKRLLALCLALLMTITCFASCRTQNENAFEITLGDKTVNIRTALYMCFLIDADLAFQDKAVATADAKGTKYEDYKELEYEGKDYETWTKDEAKESAKMYAYTDIEFERLGYTLSEEEQSYVDYYAESQWNGDESNMGVGEVYEANGISFDTYKDYFANLYWKQEMVYNFYVEEADDEEHPAEDHTHEDGSTHKAEDVKKLDEEIEKLRSSLRPADKDINDTLLKNFVPVYIIDVALTDDQGQEKNDATKKEQLNTLKNYAASLNSGAKFGDIYKIYQIDFGLVAEESAATDDATQYEQVLLSKEANIVTENGDAADENFDGALKLGEKQATVFENDDCYTLVYRRNILKDKDSSDTALKDSYEAYAINILVEDDYQKNIVDKKIAEFKVSENKSAIKFYSPKKIDYLNETTEPVAQTEMVEQ
ncbi:MAG: hypothetical protein IJD90_01095 [Clostridia bacterium]|nr:hypothetical protein [Clostridia bacterium]